MARWQRGEADVEQLIRSRELEHVTGLAADGAPLLAQAQKTAVTAAGLVQADAHSAYVLAYDAARFACIALLAQQGMRATTDGGHYAVERAVRAQFGEGSGRSRTCGAGGTSWNILACPRTQPPRTKLSRPSRLQNGCSLPPHTARPALLLRPARKTWTVAAARGR